MEVNADRENHFDFVSAVNYAFVGLTSMIDGFSQYPTLYLNDPVFFQTSEILLNWEGRCEHHYSRSIEISGSLKRIVESHHQSDRSIKDRYIEINSLYPEIRNYRANIDAIEASLIDDCVRQVKFDPKKTRIINVGCGGMPITTEYLSICFPEREIVGIDKDPEAVQLAEYRYNALGRHGVKLGNIRYLNARFDSFRDAFSETPNGPSLEIFILPLMIDMQPSEIASLMEAGFESARPTFILIRSTGGLMQAAY